MSPQGLICDLPAIDGENILMGNSMPCKTIGIDTIKIRMYDGIVRILSNVRHVSDLKKKLFFLTLLTPTAISFQNVEF